jgi:hypothetical protein
MFGDMKRRGRRLPLRPPEAQALVLLDRDGGALARIALRELRSGMPAVVPAAAPAPSAPERVATPDVSPRVAPPPAAQVTTRSGAARRGSGWRAPLVTLAVASAALWVVRRRRAAKRSRA